MEWTETEWPDWQDTGKRVEIQFADGRLACGRLEAEEFFTGEDEVPVFTLRGDDGTLHSFVDHKRWRFL